MLKNLGVIIASSSCLFFSSPAIASPQEPVSKSKLEQCRQAATSNPKSADTHFDLAMAYARTAYLESAWRSLLKVKELDPDYPKKAIARYAPQIKANPEDIEARFRISIAYYFLGQKDKSIAEHRQIIEIEPRYVWSYNYLAYLLAERGELGEAMDLIKQAIALDHDNPVAHFLQGHGYYRQGQQKEAVSAIATAMRLRLTNPI